MTPKKKTAKKGIKKVVINASGELQKMASKKTKLDRICDLVDCYIDEQITDKQLIDKIMIVIDRPIITISDVEFIVNEWENGLYLCCRAKCVNGERDSWCDVSDLSDLTVFEYNSLVEELHKHYPDYPIEYLEGRFV